MRSGKTFTLHNPVLFLARSRELAEEAWPGDIIGVPNHGNLRIGDTLTEGENIQFKGIPSFAPELLQRVRPDDPLKVKHLSRALTQLAEEGAARVFKPFVGGEWVVGVVGALQFEILAERVKTEYEVAVRFEPSTVYTARWFESENLSLIKRFSDENRASLAEDHDGSLVFLPRNAWHLNKAEEDWPGLRFNKMKEQTL